MAPSSSRDYLTNAAACDGKQVVTMHQTILKPRPAGAQQARQRRLAPVMKRS
jgi:hypothetical protein